MLDATARLRFDAPATGPERGRAGRVRRATASGCALCAPMSYVFMRPGGPAAIDIEPREVAAARFAVPCVLYTVPPSYTVRIRRPCRSAVPVRPQNGESVWRSSETRDLRGEPSRLFAEAAKHDPGSKVSKDLEENPPRSRALGREVPQNCSKMPIFAIGSLAKVGPRAERIAARPNGAMARDVAGGAVARRRAC